MTARGIGRTLGRTKPLHPGGEVHPARIIVTRSIHPASGVPWIDEPGEHRARVRVSRAIGLPWPFPDVAGLAIRTELPTGPADLLLASTGTSALGRFVLLPRRPGRAGPMTSLLPYRAPAGALYIAATPVDEHTYTLAWALGTSRWRTFAQVQLEEAQGDPPGLSFDPVLNTFPGLEQYAWVSRLREPAYRTARDQSHREA